MKRLILLLAATTLLICCDKEEILLIIESNLECHEGGLKVISDDCCGVELSWISCEVLEKEEINIIDEESYSWLPNACTEVNSEIIFTSSNEETIFTLLDRNHFIQHEVLPVACNEDDERLSSIEQRNEVLRLAFQNDLFGIDTIYIELRSIIYDYENETPAPKIDIYTLYQQESNTDILNFQVRHKLGNTGFDSNHRTFHDAIELNGKEYYSVVEFKIRSNSQMPPHTRFYINDELGFFGFEREQKLWMKI